ncbi:MAG: M24 family metallopeptidase [Lachnospiraceae bacterium]|nr:M24 family metallopeptidase [Lachnospiraceae bacterium]
MGLLDCIREEMASQGFDYFIFKDCDPHQSEYVNEYYKFRTLISGFDGSNGTLIVGKDDAYLFTDGRYFIQAENQLKDTGIKLMKLSTPGYPSIKSFVTDLVNSGKTVGASDLVFSYKELVDYGIEYSDKDNCIFLDAYKKAYGKFYPKMNPDDSIKMLDDKLTGESVTSKIEKVRKYLNDKNIDYYFSASLDSNMWLMNIRGNAIKYNPVAFSYVMITKKEVAYFYYINDNSENKDAIEDTLNELNKIGVSTFYYDNFDVYLNTLPNKETACFLFDRFPAKYAGILLSKGYKLVNDDCNVSLNKSIKNDIEIENIKKAYAKANKIVKAFLEDVKKADVSKLNEYDLMVKLDKMRLDNEDCYDLSFDTISASGPNGAMMHYESKKDACSKILKDNLYLVDSGGQWKGATTDITRTIAIGAPTEQMKHDYTRVLRGMLALMNAVFIEGCTGINLDILAREPMWEEGDDYKCGTGHGVGYMLSVHEGNHAIRWMTNPSKRETVLKPGILVSDEPGIYREGQYGIRLENILLVKEKCETPDGRFLCFECLTYVPLDEELILRDEMSDRELKWLDDYQSKC